MLYVDNLCFHYRDHCIFKGASFSLKRGKVASILGSSGIGKTTLFKLISGLLIPESGLIEISHGTNFHQSVSYMKQEALLLPWRTVWENMFLFTELGRNNKPSRSQLDAAQHQAITLIQTLGLENVRDCYPEELSGGMKQRVSLASALLRQKPLLLLDEPFSFLDILIKESLYDFLQKEVQNSDNSILLITHDFRDALALSDDIFIIQNHKIEKIGSDCYSLSQSDKDSLIKTIKVKMTL